MASQNAANDSVGVWSLEVGEVEMVAAEDGVVGILNAEGGELFLEACWWKSCSNSCIAPIVAFAWTNQQLKKLTGARIVQTF